MSLGKRWFLNTEIWSDVPSLKVSSFKVVSFGCKIGHNLNIFKTHKFSSHLVKRAADLSITSTCLNCLFMSLACLESFCDPSPPQSMTMNLTAFLIQVQVQDVKRNMCGLALSSLSCFFGGENSSL